MAVFEVHDAGLGVGDLSEDGPRLRIDLPSLYRAVEFPDPFFESPKLVASLAPGSVRGYQAAGRSAGGVVGGTPVAIRFSYTPATLSIGLICGTLSHSD